MIKPLFNYEWYLKNGYPQSLDNSVTPCDYKVFGTFINGGGSTMGYKLAGFKHLGGVEIDEKTASCYKLNHNPKHLYIQDLREFNKRDDLPSELYDLDILDGSPPCTTFSLAGLRDKSQGVEKTFAEGNKKQTLDDLLFVYTDTINKLKPKVFIMENVVGLSNKNNALYVKEFANKLQDYTIQYFLLNGANMRLPQARERFFAVGHLKKYKLPKINLNFKGEIIPFGKVSDLNDTRQKLKQSSLCLDDWKKAKQGETVGKFKSVKKLAENKPAPTLSANPAIHYHPRIPRRLNQREFCLCGSYPLDYKFTGHPYNFYIGMSVPPIMIANIAYQIRLQWLDKL